MKKCPYCAEEIQDEAILCRYCRSDLRNLNDKKDEKGDKTPIFEQFDYSCPRCGQGISAKTIQCKNCGQYINREKGLSNFMKEVQQSKTGINSSKSEGIKKIEELSNTDSTEGKKIDVTQVERNISWKGIPGIIKLFIVLMAIYALIYLPRGDIRSFLFSIPAVIAICVIVAILDLIWKSIIKFLKKDNQ